MHISLPMKIKDARFFVAVFSCACALLILGFVGCASPDQQGLMDQPQGSTNSLPIIVVGDVVTVTLSGLPEGDNPSPYEKPIKDDGKITLPDIGDVQAAGKTAGDLEKIIHDLYVPKIYTHLNVTVKISGDRVYFVKGEVKQPGRLIYSGPITVTRAITSAGDYTDFSNHRNVVLIRSNGKRYTLDCDRIMDGEDPDPPVYPGDQIFVRRKIL